MNEDDFKILVINTAARDAKLALMVCTHQLSVRRDDILDQLRKTEKNTKSRESVSSEYGITNLLAGLFKFQSVSDGTKSAQTSIPSSSSKFLIPEIGKILSENQLQPEEVDLFVVALGPGSFTGLRIGVVAAKTFAYATGCNLVGVDLMQAAVHQADWFQDGRTVSRIAVAMKAGRGDVLAATYQRGEDSEFRRSVDPSIFKPNEWAASLEQGTVATGDGVDLIDRSLLPANHLEILDVNLRSPTLQTQAILGRRKFVDSGPDNLWTMQPIYSRPSAAEETLAKSETNSN